MEADPIIEARDLTKHFQVRSGFLDFNPKIVHAVDKVNLKLYPQTTLALVGESGCGKSTLARLLLRLIEPTNGAILMEDRNLLNLKGNSAREFRKQVQIIFQDPVASLNPRKTVYKILRDPLLLHGLADRNNVRERVINLLERVGLSPASAYLNRYPREFSGGQRQRIGIARAISTQPRIIVADEPVSALDISVRAQILNLLKALQNDQALTFLLITHDLAVVRSIAQRVAVMYMGEIVETAPVDQIFNEPLHPYTQALLAATPIPDPTKARARGKIVLPGEPPSAIDPPSGCRFHPRCPFAMPECREVKPRLLPVAGGRDVACHLIHPVEKSLQ
jgi:oligopeptide/dipeptide ABC transporter ATP-binding protein